MCSTWQLSVPLNGFTCSDQRQPGSKVPRPTLCPFRSTSSTFPLPSLKSRTSSGDPKSLPLISAILPPLFLPPLFRVPHFTACPLKTHERPTAVLGLT